MPHFFEVYGPFEVSRDGRNCTSAQPEFWRQAEQSDFGVSTAIGCYMFCISHGRKITPWYIGMTVARKGFKQEVFAPHKMAIYNDCAKNSRGTPVIFLFPLCTKSKEKFSKAYSSGNRVIGWLEKMLMGFAYARNPAMSNTRDMRFLKNTTVHGVFGERNLGRPYREVEEASAALFGRRRHRT